MSLLVLLCFRDINRKQKQISDELLSVNSQVTRMVNRRIDVVQYSYCNQLLPHQIEVVGNEYGQSLISKTMINEFINNLDIDDPTTESTEVRLDRIKLEKEVDTTNKAGNILDFVVGDLGPEYNKLKTIRQHLFNRNRMLTEQHIDNVNTGIELDKLIDNNKSGSLIEDFANPSAEMPSYMDPED